MGSTVFGILAGVAFLIGWLSAAAAGLMFEGLISHLHANRTDVWRALGRPAGSGWPSPENRPFRGHSVASRLQWSLLRDAPEWAVDDTTAQGWLRRYRLTATTALWFIGSSGLLAILSYNLQR